MKKDPMGNSEDWDNNMVAVHEAGHATVAAVQCWIHGKSKTHPVEMLAHEAIEVQLGWVSAEIQPTPTNNAVDEKTWTGSTNYGLMDLDESDRAIISVAGIVAECLHSEKDINAATIVDYWEEGVIEPSPTDYTGIPDSGKDRLTAVERALDLLRENNELWNAIVAELKQNEFITNGILKNLVERHR